MTWQLEHWFIVDPSDSLMNDYSDENCYIVAQFCWAFSWSNPFLIGPEIGKFLMRHCFRNNMITYPNVVLDWEDTLPWSCMCVGGLLCIYVDVNCKMLSFTIINIALLKFYYCSFGFNHRTILSECILFLSLKQVMYPANNIVQIFATKIL